MIADPMQMTALIDDLSNASWTLAAIALLFESGLAEALREPRTIDDLAARFDALPRDRIARCLAVVELKGIVIRDGDRWTIAPGAPPSARHYVQAAELRSVLMQTLAYLDAATAPAPMRGWYHTNPKLLQAQGDSSAGFANALAGPIGPMLEGILERFATPTARMLDVGVGVGSLSIAMCRNFPQLKAVGLDTFDVPLSLARENVRRAELDQRIELRQLAIEDLREVNAYDLVWLPACFLAQSSIPAAVTRAREALRPGGWLISPSINTDADEQTMRIWSMVLEHWGVATDSAMVERWYSDGGFTPKKLRGPGWIALVAGQKR